MIKKAFIITLAESSLSVQLSKDCFDAAVKHGMEPVIWPATNGLHAKRLFAEEGISNLGHKKINALVGVQGCFLSHYYLWKKCIELNEPICILEHDGFFIRPLPDDVEDHFTEILNLDPNPQYEGTYSDMVNESLSRPIAYFTPTTNKSGGEQKRSQAGTYVGGAYGYCIKPIAAKKLIQFAKNVAALPTDKHIGQSVVDLKMTSATVVRLHQFYAENSIRKNSSTKALTDFIDQ